MPLTIFAGQMPDPADPPTYSARAEALMAYLTGVAMPELSLALDGHATFAEAMEAARADLAAANALARQEAVVVSRGQSVLLRDFYTGSLAWLDDFGAFDLPAGDYLARVVMDGHLAAGSRPAGCRVLGEVRRERMADGQDMALPAGALDQVPQWDIAAGTRYQAVGLAPFTVAPGDGPVRLVLALEAIGFAGDTQVRVDAASIEVRPATFQAAPV